MKSTKPSLNLDASLLILGLTSTTYLAAYLYQAAYVHYYGLSYQIIKLSIENLLFLGAIFFLVSVILAPILRSTITSLQVPSSKTYPVYIELFFALAFDISITVVAIVGIINVVNYTGLSETGKSLWIFIPLIIIQRVISIRDNSEYKVAANKQERLGAYRNIQRKYLKVDLFILVLVAVFFFSASTGKSSAENKKTYTFVGKNKVVIYETDNTLVVENISKDRLVGTYELINLNTLTTPLNFTERRVTLKP